MKEGLILFNMMQNNFEFLMFLKRNGISFSNFPLTLMFICVSHHNEAVENTKKNTNEENDKACKADFTLLNPFFLIHINTISMDLSSLYIKGSQVKLSKF